MTDEPNGDDLVDESGADEALDAPAEETEAFEDFSGGEELGGIDAGALLAEAEEDQMRSRASWHLLHKEIFAFLFANCLFFTAAIATWTRGLSWGADGGAGMSNGLDSTRGAFMFALALYGFWNFVFYLIGRQMKVWPYVLNALIALWVGIGGITSGIGGPKWEAAKEYLNTEGLDKTALDDAMVPLSTIGPGYWLMTVGGALVVIMILKGLMSGHQQAKAQAAEQQGDGRRRRR